jgi:hypothetical protein
MRGFAQYYAIAVNFSAMNKLRYLWVQSFLKTMANKYKSSMQKIATMLNRGGYMAVREKDRLGKVRECKLFKLKDVDRKAIFDSKMDNPPMTYQFTTGHFPSTETYR